MAETRIGCGSEDRFEDLTQALQDQVDFYKVENNNLMTEVTNLINDNTKLSSQVESVLKDRAYDYKGSANPYRIQFNDMKNQLDLTLREKESVTKLWQNAETTIQSLEDELKTYQFSSGTQIDLAKIKKQYGQVIAAMEMKLSELSAELKNAQDRLEQKERDLNIAEQKLEEKEVCLSTTDKRLNEANATIHSLEHDIVVLNNDLSTEKRNHEEVLGYVDMCRRNMEIYVRKESESKIKISEALALVDAAIAERDSALQREKEACEEMRQLSTKVTAVLNESSVRIQSEIDTARKSYDEKLNDMLIHIQRTELELGDKNLLLERAIRECRILEGELEKYRVSKENVTDDNLSKLLLLEQKLEATFQQLLISERKVIQVTSEKEALQMDMDQITNDCKRDIRKKEWERDFYLTEISRLRTRLEDLKRLLADTESKFKSSRAEWKAREVNDKTLIEQKNAAIEGLENHMEKRQTLNERWRDDTKKIIAKLQTRLKDMHQENWSLRKLLEKSNADNKT